jgi:ribulose-phosphate 3-epimerase
MKHLVAPSILSADFARLGEETQMINGSLADWFHVDVMDGVFVPNISLGFPVVKAIKKHASKPLDVHLMIIEPQKYIEEFRDAGADILTVHLEASVHLHRTVAAIRQAGMKAGVAINPHTPVSALYDIIGDIDLVCMMAVNPGFGGQKFIPRIYNKVAELKRMIRENRSSALIEIDGGVSIDNARQLLEAGANVLVAGNAVFSAKDPSGAIKDLKSVEAGTQLA